MVNLFKSWPQALICLVDKKTGEKSKTRPRFVKQDQVCIARLRAAGVICLETFKDFPQMGRFTLRDEGKTSVPLHYFSPSFDVGKKKKGHLLFNLFYAVLLFQAKLLPLAKCWSWCQKRTKCNSGSMHGVLPLVTRGETLLEPTQTATLSLHTTMLKRRTTTSRSEEGE